MGKFSRLQIDDIFLIFPKETICMKDQILFSRKKYFKMLSAVIFTLHAVIKYIANSIDHQPDMLWFKIFSKPLLLGQMILLQKQSQAISALAPDKTLFPTEEFWYFSYFSTTFVFVDKQ